jgi:serine/threonine-protein kinase
MAPEQLLRGRNVDARADVWSVGAILFLLLTGEHTYGGVTAAEFVRRCASSPPRRVGEVSREVPPALAAVVDRALAPCVADRVHGARELAGMLTGAVEAGEAGEAALHGPTGTAVMARPSLPPAPPAALARRAIARGDRWLGAAATVAATLVTGIACAILATW